MALTDRDHDVPAAAWVVSGYQEDALAGADPDQHSTLIARV